MANYNHAKYLRESLGGVCGQTRPADEIIVIDDCSTDNSVEIICEFMAKHPQLRLIRNEQRMGPLDAIARAMPFVKSDYMVWTAADDRLLPEFVEKSMAALERHPQAGLCFSETTELSDVTGESNRFAIEPTVRHIFNLDDFPEYMRPADLVERMRGVYLPIAANTVVVRRDAMPVGYPRQLEWHADSFAYTAVALRRGACVVPETLALIRATPGSYSKAMQDPVRQSVVLRAMLDLIASSEYRDIRRMLRQCPSYFAPWDTLMLKIQLRNIRDWDLFFPYLVFKIREYKRGHQLTWPRTFAHMSARLGRVVRATAGDPVSRVFARKDPPHLLARIDGLQSALAEVTAARDKDATRLGDMQAERDGAANELFRLRAECAAEKEVVGKQLAELAQELERTRSEAAQINANRVLLFAQLEAERDALAVELDHVRKQASEAEASLTLKLKDLPAERARLAEESDRLRRDGAEMQVAFTARIAQLEAQRHGLSPELERLRVVEKDVHVLVGKLGDMEAQREGLANELERTRKLASEQETRLAEENGNLKTQCNGLQSEIERLRQVESERHVLAGKVGDLEAEREGLANELERTRKLASEQETRLAEENGNLKTQCNGLQSEIERLRQVESERHVLAGKVGDLEAERDGLANELERIRQVAFTTQEKDTAEKRSLAAEKEGLAVERENLVAEKNSLTGELAAVRRDYLSIKSIEEDSRRALEATRLPPMLITTMPKSGTYYISKLLSEGLFIQTRIVSHQYFPEDVIRQPELRVLSQGSCISQDHFGASQINVTHIKKHVDRMIVHLRDPRQALLSYVHYLDTKDFRGNEKEAMLFIYPPLPENFYDMDLAARIDWGIHNWLPLLVQWVEGWVEAESQHKEIRIKFTRYEDLVSDRGKFIAEVLDFFAIPLGRYIPLKTIDQDVAIHFRKGEVDEWRRVFSPNQVATANARIPRELAARFGWSMRKPRS